MKEPHRFRSPKFYIGRCLRALMKSVPAILNGNSAVYPLFIPLHRAFFCPQYAEIICIVPEEHKKRGTTFALPFSSICFVVVRLYALTHRPPVLQSRSLPHEFLHHMDFLNQYKDSIVRTCCFHFQHISQPLRDGAFVMDKAICLNDSIIPYNPFAVLLPDHISEFSCHPGNMPMRQSQKVTR